MTTQEWKDLPDMWSVALAQADGWEIEVHNPTYACWNEWEGTRWSGSAVYRGRPKQPKTRTVKLLGWLTASGQLTHWRDSVVMPEWKRVPAEDKVIEVEE
jgi:hypothetical protein